MGKGGQGGNKIKKKNRETPVGLRGEKGKPTPRERTGGRGDVKGTGGATALEIEGNFFGGGFPKDKR